MGGSYKPFETNFLDKLAWDYMRYNLGYKNYVFRNEVSER